MQCTNVLQGILTTQKTKMIKIQIFCNKCNKKFTSLMDLSHHICPNKTAPKWGHKIGRNQNKEKDFVEKQLGDSWLEKAEEQRKKNKSRNVYKKNYRRSSNKV